MHFSGLPRWLCRLKNLPANAGDTGSIPESGRSSGVGNGTHSSILAWETHGERSLVSYSPWGRKGLDPTEQPTTYAFPNWNHLLLGLRFQTFTNNLLSFFYLKIQELFLTLYSPYFSCLCVCVACWFFTTRTTQEPLFFQVIYPKELRAGSRSDICSPMFIAALFEIAKSGRNSNAHWQTSE